jgi:membrane fusion protein (multidrug efflux system)
MSSAGPHELEARLRVLREEEQALQKRLATLKENGHPSGELVRNEALGDDASLVRKDATPLPRHGRHLLQLIALAILLPVLAFGGWRWWQYLDTYESTDDAQVDGHIAPISSRISGTIARVYIQDTDLVKAGQLVAEIDPRDEQATANSARANLAQAKAQLNSARADYTVALSRVREAEATDVQAKRDVERYTSLFEQHIVANAEYDDKIRAEQVDDAAVMSARAAAASAFAAIGSHQAAADSAQAALDQALLGLEYTRIVAPLSGVVGKKTVEVGQRVQPGQQLLAIVPLDDIWITANFKETQLRRIRRGQRVTIHVDVTGREYEGYVEGLAGASGEKYSLLPAENATGNYVKVVQRLPIRIRLVEGQNQDHGLRPGMSVEPSVWLR